MDETCFKTGDLVIYRQRKFGRQPGPSARDVTPSPNGDDNSYTVEQFCLVSDIDEDGTVVVRSESGTCQTLNQDDPLLRRATLLERFLSWMSMAVGLSFQWAFSAS